jgi:hypothetical protein
LHFLKNATGADLKNTPLRGGKTAIMVAFRYQPDRLKKGIPKTHHQKRNWCAFESGAFLK